MSLKDLFLLESDVVFLNHGSFGACPRPVFAAYQAWQRRLEAQPVRFIQRELDDYMAQAREALGGLINAPADDLVFVPNPTFAVNTVARSLRLGPGDEVLVTDHEYGACLNAWRFMSQQRGFAVVEQPLPWPITNNEAIVGQFWQGVTPHTKLIFMSHITSPTALTLPVAEIGKRAQDAGILFFVDGAHVAGQLPLDLTALDPDFYTGTCHKWLMAPKGSAFLYTKRAHQPLIEPLVVGWGWGEQRSKRLGSDYLDYHQWLGTNDYSAYLTVPAAIAFQQEHDWETVRAACHALAVAAVQEAVAITGQPAAYADDGFYAQMGLIALPPGLGEMPAFKARLYDRYHIEIPAIDWQGRHFLRVSIQGYNSREDVGVLLGALAEEVGG